jgi:hypothetical protein
MFVSQSKTFFIHLCLVLLMLCLAASSDAMAQGNFVMVSNTDGSSTTLRQKLVTKKRVRLRQTPSDRAEGTNVLPYNIFFQLKTSSGKEEENGFLRVGDESGKFLGWIEAENLVKWSTRYVIAPREADTSENRFKVDTDQDGSANFEFNPDVLPQDASVNAFITGPPVGKDADEENGPFPVAMLTARVAASAAAAAELDAINKMKLEVVFVIENTSFMNAEYSGKSLHRYTIDMAQRFVDSYSGKTGEIPTRFGLVCYQDSVSDATIKTPVVLQPLTENHSQWRSEIANMKPLEARNDLPADGISALALAKSNAVGWSSNSSKHVVLLGHSALNDAVNGGECSFHASIRGRLERLFEVPNAGLFTRSEDSNWVGSNTSGISQTQLLQSYQSVTGLLGERLRNTYRLHAVRVGYTVRDRLIQEAELKPDETDDFLQVCKTAFADMNDKARPLSDSQVLIALGSPEVKPYLDVLITAAQIQNLGVQDRFAPQQYKTLAGGDGYYANMLPTGESVTSTTENLRKKIQSAVDLINQVATDNVDMDSDRNEFTAPIYRMISSATAGEKVIDDPVKEGTAPLRNERGRSLGEKLVMVSKNELELLKSNFDSLYTTFRSKQKRSDRQDVGGILLDLQRLLASSAAGQKIDANTDLSELITDLPLRTEALQITASDIAVMNTAAFDSWLEDLQLARDAAQKELDTGNWITVNERSDLEYGFLRLSSLP